jgi:hypothetical protein
MNSSIGKITVSRPSGSDGTILVTGRCAGKAVCQHSFLSPTAFSLHIYLAQVGFLTVQWIHNRWFTKGFHLAVCLKSLGAYFD